MLRRIFSKYRKEALFLPFLIGLNSVLRFYGLSGVGFITGDEISYYLVSKNALEASKQALFSSYWVSPNMCGFFQPLQILVQYPPKFIFYFFNSIALAFNNSPATILFTSAISSILSILTVFFIGRKYFNFRVGAIASILLSFSLIYLRFSRSGYSMALTYFFLVLSVYFYMDSLSGRKSKSLSFSGLMLGFSLLAHSQAVFFLCLLIFIDISGSLLFDRSDIKSLFKRTTVFTCFFFVPLAILEMSINAGRALKCFSTDSYFRQILNTVFGNTAAMQGVLPDPFFYANLLWFVESPVIALLVLASLFLVVRQFFLPNMSRRRAFLVFSMFFLTFIYWFLQKKLHQTDYNILGAWPFLFLTIAIGFDGFFGKIKTASLRFITVSIFMIIALAYSLYNLRTFFEIKSYYPEVCRILKEKNVKKMITYRNLGIRGYQEIDSFLNKIEIFPADNIKQVDKIIKENGVQYVFYDPWGFFIANEKDQVVQGKVAAEIRETVTRQHFPLFYLSLMYNKINNTKDADIYSKKVYDNLYLYEVEENNTRDK